MKGGTRVDMFTLPPALIARLAPGVPAAVARAPARLDVMGGIADYSGATVLQLPLVLGALVAAQRTNTGLLEASTAGPAAPSLAHPTSAIPGAVLRDGPASDAPERLRAALDRAGAPWAAYLLGPLAMLHAAGQLVLPAGEGLRLALWSEVPAGAGISSSAALEVAALRAVAALYGLVLDPLALAVLAQQAEHRVAGAPCGLMDQATSALGRKDHLLVLRCQAASDHAAEVLGHRRLPRDARVLGVDSRVTHRVAGAQYGRVRTAAFMGRAIIRAHDPAALPRGYLCNLAPARFADSYAPLLPVSMDGAHFAALYGATGDAATHLDTSGATPYAVRDCTAHPVYEAANVRVFLDALDSYERTGEREALARAGEAMAASHRSYGTRCGLGTPETDLIVELVRAAGPTHGLYGARITGGGAGGTVAVLGAGPDVDGAVRAVARAYGEQTGNPARVIAGSADGALATPVQWVEAGGMGEVQG